MSYSETIKIAIVHDWFDQYAGSERVVEQLLEIFPQADLFSLVDLTKPSDRAFLKNKHVTTTFIQRLPFAKKYFRNYLPLFPLAIEQLDLRNYDLILSSSHAVAKGVLIHSDQLHICYCHSPMRYAWDLYHQYMEEAGLTNGLKAFFVKRTLHKLRMWDQLSAQRVHHFIANSGYIGRRIRTIYNRSSNVIFPPVNTDVFSIAPHKGDYYFTAARMVPYKKLDLIAEAFSAMPDKKLIITGQGTEWKKIRKKAGPNVVILEQLSQQEFKKYVAEAKAFVYAAEEDFGIVMAEAQAAGVPVIAFRKGGASEIVQDQKTGILYDEQTTSSIIDAVNRFEQLSFDPYYIRAQAERFSVSQFKKNCLTYVEECLTEFYNLQKG